MRFVTRAKIWLMDKSLDVRMGQCSGIPNCCIAWFISGWKLAHGDLSKSLYEKAPWRAKFILWYHERANNAGYVPCPLCLLSGARVRVLKCTDECGHYRECEELGRRRRWVRDP